MPKQVLDVGNCVPDHASIKSMLEKNFGVTVLQTHGPEDTMQLLKETKVDLILINRKLDRDYTDGMITLNQIKSDAELANTPVMLITNFDDHQDAAEAAGALRGFGKLSLGSPETKAMLEAVLS
ncbi:MAG: response regulator [Blastopirellula sp.]|nr:MAG: response regulator [Blastopirellula sp.]